MKVSFVTINILDLVDAIGEENTRCLLADFSCNGLNDDLEDFVRNKAIAFAKGKLSITYLVMEMSEGALGHIAGIFTLTHKAIEIYAGQLSKTSQKKLARFAVPENDLQYYTLSAFLIAQFSKILRMMVKRFPETN